MKSFLSILAVLALAACHREAKPVPPRKVESINDIPLPKNVSPPVQAKSYDEGYKAGDLAGEAFAKAEHARAPKRRPELPANEQLDVLALEAAGTDTEKGQKWQRGFVAGYRDGFVRVAEGKR